MFRTKKRDGFSLIELLVVIAIISILMAMYMSTLAKVRGRAKQIAAAEGLRQKALGEMADNVNTGRMAPVSSPVGELPERPACRAAYRQTIQTGWEERVLTELLYAVEDEAQFRAYWHTLINPDNTDDLEFEGTRLIAKDEDDNTYLLQTVDAAAATSAPFPVAWDFLSTAMNEMTIDGLGANVLYSDGHVKYIPYQRMYPSCQTVAKLSHQFMEAL